MVKYDLVCRENRYVLFLTENYAALDILMNPNNYLGEGLSFAVVKRETADHPAIQQDFEPETEVESSQAQAATDARPASEVQPFILFGSSFPKDKEYTQVGKMTRVFCAIVVWGGGGGSLLQSHEDAS